MAHQTEDRILETSTSTGTGTFALAGAMTGYQSFASRLTVADTCHYMIEAVDGSGVPTGEWEVGKGTYSATNVLTRTTVIRSSNADAAVSFAAGTKRVGLIVAAPTTSQMKSDWRLALGLGTLAVLSTTGSTTTFLRGDGTFATPAGGGGSGDVVGPASATDNSVVVFDSTTGKLVKQAKLTGAHIGPGAYDANAMSGDDSHWLEVTNDPSVVAGVAGAGKQLIRFNSYGSPGYGGNVHFCRYRGTEASPTAVQSGDTFMSFGIRGHDGTGLSQSAASFAAQATENWTAGAHGIKWLWQVTPNGSTSRGDGMELTSSGLAVTGTVSATVAVSSPASTTTSAGLKVPHGTAPTSPVNGDIWTTTAGAYARINGVTVGPFASAAGSATWGSITGTLASQADLQAALDAKGAAGIPQNSQSAAYTLVLADANKHILHPSADTTARIWTIPANSSVAYPIGTAITFVNQNAGGVITIAITTDTMRLAGAGTTGSRTLAANGMATALKITSTEWIISGTGLT